MIYKSDVTFFAGRSSRTIKTSLIYLAQCILRTYDNYSYSWFTQKQIANIFGCREYGVRDRLRYIYKKYIELECIKCGRPILIEKEEIGSCEVLHVVKGRVLVPVSMRGLHMATMPDRNVWRRSNFTLV